MHCIWLCPCNHNIDDDNIRNSEYLIKSAKFSVSQQPCLWLRGILPANKIQVPDDESLVTESIHTIIGDPILIESGTYYGDASGGTYTKYPEIRRVGLAFTKIDEVGELVCGHHFPLSGDIQTVARGELFALSELIKLAVSGSDIDFVTDNKPNCDTFDKGPKWASTSSNCDLFHHIFQQTYLKAIKLTVRWMPSHSDKKPGPLPSDVTPLDVLGNAFADKFADEAATPVQVSLNVGRKCIHFYNLVKKIQHRIAAIMSNLPDRKKLLTVRATKETQRTLETQMLESAHNVVKDGERYTCVTCTNSFLKTDTLIQSWLQTSCRLLPISNRPTSIENDSLHIGNLSIHSSHRLATHRGLIYCNSCGSRAGACLKNLARSCNPRTVYGKLSLKAIRNDCLPPNLDSWPAG